MTIEALNSSPSGVSKDALPIGEVDANIFNCPACARPLGVGASRCPGCGTRLIIGVQATRAGALVVVGLVVGLVVGAGGFSVASALTRVDPVTAGGGTVVQPTAAPVASAAPLPTAAPIAAPVVPFASLSALRQTALINQRVVADAGQLIAVLASPTPSTAEIAKALRSMSSNATFGERIAGDVAAWDLGAGVAGDLSAFYAGIRSTAAAGLSGSLSNQAGYVAAAEQMLALVAGLGQLDGAARALAAQADVELPLVDVPSAPVTSTP